MKLIATLSDVGLEADQAAVGGKFAALAELRTSFSIPAAVCVTAAAFNAALTAGERRAVERFFQDVRATVGAFLPEAHAELWRELHGLAVPPAARQALAEAMAAELRPGPSGFAVRSSAVGEDEADQTMAGVYESFLGMRDLDQICDAVAACWRSYYSYRAVMARIRQRDFSPAPRMAVIVQDLVNPVLAGVAFSDGPSGAGVEIEYVEGLANDLLAGCGHGRRFVESEPGPAPDELDLVVQTVRRLAAHAGRPVDVEWAYDSHRVHVLQARPARVGKPRPSGPRFSLARLYLDVRLPTDLDLADCADVYTLYTSKRAGVYRRAAAEGVLTGPGLVVCFDGPGLAINGPALLDALDLADGAGSVVVDLGATVRQLVLPADGLLPLLARSCNPGGGDVQTAIVRRFLHGEAAFISRFGDDDTLWLDVTTEGLLALNRGLCDAATLTIPPGRSSPASWANVPDDVARALQANLTSVARFTRLCDNSGRGTQLEWVLDQGRPYFVDFSSTGAEVVRIERQAGAACVCAGTAAGPLVRLDDEALLARLSTGSAVSIGKEADMGEHEGLVALRQAILDAPAPPVVHAARPYAVLSVLFDDVAAFVFEAGSLLCHLAVLLRERGIPAVIAPGLPARIGDDVLVADGRVEVVTRATR